jgi:hypothetical protein
MPKPDFINDPNHWHQRAAEIRALAETMAGVETRAIMLKLVADYDKGGNARWRHAIQGEVGRADVKAPSISYLRNTHNHASTARAITTATTTAAAIVRAASVSA